VISPILRSRDEATVAPTPATLILPALSWFVFFIVIPLSIVLVYSFSTRGTYGGVVFQFTWENYIRALDWVYLKIFFNSLKLATLTTFSCLVIGYPVAFVMATSGTKLRNFLLMLVVVPFWTNFIVRVYAVKLVLSEQGPLMAILTGMGVLSAPLDLNHTAFAVWVGMVTNYLPFMVLPLYVALEKFDFTLLEAARDLGASSRTLLTRVLFPMTKAGVVTGCIFVFTPALGEFVIPDLLGGARSMLIGNLVTEQFLKTRDWPFGAALSLLLIVTVMGTLWIYLRSNKTGEVA
jgi:spermidine/putrescine transport system permease protein